MRLKFVTNGAANSHKEPEAINHHTEDRIMSEQKEIDVMGINEYAQFALEKANIEYAGTFMEGSCDLDTFKELWINHHSTVRDADGNERRVNPFSLQAFKKALEKAARPADNDLITVSMR